MASTTSPGAKIFLIKTDKTAGSQAIPGTKIRVNYAKAGGSKAQPFDAEVLATTFDDIRREFERQMTFLSKSGVLARRQLAKRGALAPNQFRLALTFGLHVEPELTAMLLSQRVAPLIKAITDLQLALNPTLAKPARIASISQASPIEVSFEGIAEAYKALREDIVPWRQRHQKELAALEEAVRREEIAKKKSEVVLAEAKTATQIAEAKKLAAEAAALEQEVESKRFHLKREKVEFAVDLAAKMLPSGTHLDRIELVTRLLPTLDTLMLTQPEVTLVERIDT